MSQILIVDDEPSICWTLQQALVDEGHEVSTVASAEEASRWYTTQTPDVILMDVRLPGQDGLSAMQALPQSLSQVPVIVMTAFGNLETAVQAIGAGAFEYLPKPFDLDDVVAVISRALEVRPRVVASDSLENQELSTALIGKSPAMQAVFRKIALVAAHDVPVLICGESGTGKEVVAQALHNYSSRSEGAFVPICVPAMNAGIVESELFGHRSGAFTGASADRLGLLQQADAGTAFFDEIGDVALATQVKLLRVLETKQVMAVGSNEQKACHFRLIAATNRPLERMVVQGEFREDLYYRLNVFRIDLPPLRDRGEDILLLADHFLKQFQPHAPCELSQDAADELMQRPWYGNVRELRNVIEHAAIMSRTGRIEKANLPAPLQQSSEANPSSETLTEAVRQWLQQEAEDAGVEQGLLDHFLRQSEPVLIEHALQARQGNRQEAAQLLGIHRQTLREKMRRYGLEESGA